MGLEQRALRCLFDCLCFFLQITLGNCGIMWDTYLHFHGSSLAHGDHSLSIVAFCSRVDLFKCSFFPKTADCLPWDLCSIPLDDFLKETEAIIHTFWDIPTCTNFRKSSVLVLCISYFFMTRFPLFVHISRFVFVFPSRLYYHLRLQCVCVYNAYNLCSSCILPTRGSSFSASTLRSSGPCACQAWWLIGSEILRVGSRLQYSTL